MTETTTCPTCGATLPAGTDLGACPRCLLQAGLGDSDPGAAAPASDAPAPAEIAPQFPGLEILELIGQGGMGVVYKARQVGLDRLVALKILPASVSDDPAFSNRFTREARTMARLDHPNIVRVHDFGEAGGRFYLLMEYVDGSNLRQAIQAKALEPREALAIVPQICDALQYAHDHGVVHRDIKPENVLLDRTGRVKITDFGLAKLMLRGAGEMTLTNAGQVMGTPQYMAPEQYRTPGDVDHRADIYSLGVVFYEMLTGDLPMGRFAPPSRKVEIDVRLDDVVLRTLERERDRRYQRAEDVRTEVTSIASAKAPVRRPVPVPARAPAESRLSRLALFGFLCLPASIVLPLLVAAVVSAFTGGEHVVVATYLLTPLLLLLGFVLSLAGWISVARSRGARKGLGLAVAGTVVPFPLFLVIVFFGWLLVSGDEPVDERTGGPGVSHGWVPESPSPASPPALEGRPEPKSDDASARDAIEAVWRELTRTAVLKGVTPADLERFVAITDRKRVEYLRPEDRDRLREEDLLGLAFSALPDGPAAVPSGGSLDIDFDPGHVVANVTMDGRHEFLSCWMIRGADTWTFALGPVMRSREGLASWTTPSIVSGGDHGRNAVVDREIQTQVEVLWSVVQHFWELGPMPHHARVPRSMYSHLLPRAYAGMWTTESAEDLAKKGRAGDLGLLFLDAETLPRPLGAYTLASIDVATDGWSALVTARAGEEEFAFEVVRWRGRWWLAVSPLVK